MIRWTRDVSWSKLRLALECPKKLGYAITKTPTDKGITYWSVLGTTVQYVFELYYNMGVFKHEAKRGEDTFIEITKRVLISPWMDRQGLSYPPTKVKEDFENEVKRHVMGGRKLMSDLGLLDKPIRSEVRFFGKLRDMPAGGKIDFLYELPKNYVRILDGKATTKMNADPGQIKFYGLLALSRGLTAVDSGLLYWDKGFQSIDTTPKALKEFLDGPVEQGLKIFRRLENGVESLPALPEPTKCMKCEYKRACPEAAVEKDIRQMGEQEIQMGFGDARG